MYNTIPFAHDNSQNTGTTAGRFIEKKWVSTTAIHIDDKTVCCIGLERARFFFSSFNEATLPISTDAWLLSLYSTWVRKKRVLADISEPGDAGQ